ncbi:MAG: hypothetical protein GKR91_05685 [Pseudomonadales bacterium]|nr:hypothetical protein [Pseudomonadales bacterium]
MKHRNLILAATLLVVLASVVFYQYSKNHQLAAQLDQQNDLRAQLLEQTAGNAQERLALQNQIELLEVSLASALNQVTNLSEALQDFRENNNVNIEELRLEVEEEIARENQARLAHLQSPAILQAFARTSVLEEYDAYLNTNIENEDRRNLIIELLIEIQAEHDRILNEMSAQELIAHNDDPTARNQFFIDNMSSHLTNEEALAFEEYVGNSKERIFRKFTTSNVVSVAPNLSNEARDDLVQSLYFEMIENAENTERPDPLDHIALTFWEEEAMKRAQSALSQQLSPDELNEANRYFEQQLNRLELSREVWRAQRSATQ